MNELRTMYGVPVFTIVPSTFLVDSTLFAYTLRLGFAIEPVPARGHVCVTFTGVGGTLWQDGDVNSREVDERFWQRGTGFWLSETRDERNLVELLAGGPPNPDAFFEPDHPRDVLREFSIAFNEVAARSCSVQRFESNARSPAELTLDVHSLPMPGPEHEWEPEADS